MGGVFLTSCYSGAQPESETSSDGGTGSGDGTGSGSEDTSAVKLPAIPDSWDFVSQTGAAWVTSLDSYKTASTTADGTVNPTSDIDIKGKDEKLTLTLLKSDETNKNLINYKDKLSASGVAEPSFSYVDPTLGLRIKGTAIKIAGAQGKIGLKIFIV